MPILCNTYTLVPFDGIFGHTLPTHVRGELFRNDGKDVLESLSPSCFIGHLAVLVLVMEVEEASLVCLDISIQTLNRKRV